MCANQQTLGPNLPSLVGKVVDQKLQSLGFVSVQPQTCPFSRFVCCEYNNLGLRSVGISREFSRVLPLYTMPLGPVRGSMTQSFACRRLGLHL